MLNIEQQKAAQEYICDLIDNPGASSSELEALKIWRLKTERQAAIIKERIVEERIKKVEDQLKKYLPDNAVFNNLLSSLDELTKQKNKIHSAGAELIKVCQQLEKDTKRKDEIYSKMTDALLEGNEELREALESEYYFVTESIANSMMY